MYFSKTTIVSFGLLASSPLVAGHGAIIRATGDAGGAGSAIGVVPTTPRDGTNRNPFQQDSTRFRGDAAATCGETLGGGANDVNAGTAQVMQLSGAALPQVSAGGSLMMTVHQVNSDGAGPYKCMIDSTGTGTNWTPVTVTQNLAGNDRGRNRDTQMQDLPLTVQIDAAQTCTGTVAGQSGVCMVRCENPARAGPFGGCVPMQLAGAAAAAPAAAAPAAAAPAAAAPAAAAPAAGAAAPVASAAAPVASAAAGAATDATTGAATDATAGTGAVAGAGAATGATAATATTNNNLAARRERAAKASKAPALTNDDQEEEIDLLD
jgi:pyruvate/2-oxoglutarate dehydrogenase complex dihydrolipoamide acyltransferase (E2) component